MTGLEWAIMVFFMGRTLLEIQQLRAIYIDMKRYKQRELKMNQRLKESFKVYTRSSWNCLDLVTLIVYSCAFFLKIAVWSSSTTTVVNNRALIVSGYLYGLNTMILTFRVFGQVMETVKGLGTIQIALFSIISDVATIFWQFAAAILAFSFAITKVYMTEISFIPTRFNGTDPVCKTSGQSCWWLTAKHLCWSLLGMAEVDSLNSVDETTVTLCKVLYAIYLVVAGVLLMNMMIALLSNTYQRVEENSLKEWSFKKAITDQTYMYLHPVPVPLNIISCIVMGVVCLCKKRIGRCPCVPECRGFFTPEDDQPRDRLDVIVEDLQNTYFTAYGDAFPGTGLC
ncbi:short transient receptor potential channel 7-like [Porites lutea]|uniref:short transient receptor potential channel 7-like n=1 Tax=Porites lutea TaxID=51062 RepID=UPI003CC61734